MTPRINKGTIEYTVTIGRAFNRETNRECIRFFFQTAEEFTYFQYLISIQVETDSSRINFHILGLKPKGVSLPSHGKASMPIDFYNLKGKYHIKIYKQGDSVNNFEIKFLPKTIRISREIKQKSPFVSVALI